MEDEVTQLPYPDMALAQDEQIDVMNIEIVEKQVADKITADEFVAKEGDVHEGVAGDVALRVEEQAAGATE